MGENRLTNKHTPNTEPLIVFNVPTVATLVLIILAVLFAYLGFSNAGDSRVDPLLISVYLVISGIGFIAVFVLTIRHPGIRRVIAIISIMAGVFVTIMAFVFYQALSTVQMPSF